ncbi:MAG: hypothetical protein ABUS49_05810 [Acidobacteriota bacterium]
MLVAALICSAAPIARATDLSLSSAVTSAGGSATLSLALNVTAAAPAALQWNIAYAPAQLSGVSITAGPAASSAAKTLSCVSSAGGANCILAGLNATPLGSGVVAYVSATLSPGINTASIQVLNALGADAGANGLVLSSGAAGTIAVPAPSQLLTPVTSVNGQQIQDFNGSSVLFTQSGAGSPTLLLHDIASGTDKTIFSHPGVTIANGFLTSRGAIFVVSGSNQATYEYRDGQLLSFAHDIDDGTATSDTALVLKGSYALWRRNSTGSSALYLRDLNAGTNTVFSQAGTAGGDVGPDGSVVYASGGDIYRWTAGTTIRLTSDGVNLAPVTDGANVIYEKSTGGKLGLYKFNGLVESVLSPLAARGASFDFTYQATGGYIAFTVNDTFNDQQVYLATPSATRAVSHFGTSSSLAALAANGDIAYLGAAGLLLQRLSQTDSIVVAAGSGVPLNLNNQWYYIDGNTVYLVGDGVPGVYQGAGAIRISAVAPVNNAAVADPVGISANISSYYAFQSVTATAGANSMNLVAGQPGVFSGMLPLTGLTGLQTIAFVATDIYGHWARTTVPVVVNSPLTVTSPVSRQLTQGPLQVTATCGGCVSMRAVLDGSTVATGGNSMNQTIQVAGAARGATLYVYGADSAGHEQVASVNILYEPNSVLTPVTSVNGQQIFDFDGVSVLYEQWINSGASYSLLTHPVTGGSDTVLLSPVPAGAVNAFLTVHGAIFTLQNRGTADGAVYESRDGQLLSFGHTYNDGNTAVVDAGLTVKGGYAVWKRADSSSGLTTLYLRDLIAGLTSRIADVPGPSNVDAGPDGSVVFSRGGNIYKWSNGAISQLTFDGVNDRPVTDGVNTVYVKSGGAGAAGLYSSSYFGATPLETIAVRGADFAYEYLAARSSVVFTGTDAFSTQQLYVSTPNGGYQLSHFGSKTDPLLLASNGDIFFQTRRPAQPARYYLQRLTESGVLLVSASDTPGLPLYAGGQWYYAEGNTVLAIGRSNQDDYQGAGSIQLSVTSPAPNAVVGSGLAMTLGIDSYYALQSVTARMGLSSTLIYGYPGGIYSGTLWTTDLTGAQTLTITAMDIFGHTVQSAVPVKIQ